MIPVHNWAERKFNFDLPVWMFPNIVSRLRGTPARLEDLIRNVPTKVLTHRDGDHWSIQENAGHLQLVDGLWMMRMDDFAAGLDRLQPADMKNTATRHAGLNEKEIGKILADFRRARANYVTLLEQLDDDQVVQSAHHDRLNTRMRQIDLAFFAAEHDDHHLALISELMRKFGDA